MFLLFSSFVKQKFEILKNNNFKKYVTFFYVEHTSLPKFVRI